MIGLKFMAALRAGFGRALPSAAIIVVGGSIAGASAAPMTDPVGDAVCIRSVGTCTVAYDLTTVDAFANGAYFVVRGYLNQNIALVPSQVPNPDPTELWRRQFGGYIDIDTDQNEATGTPAWGDYFNESPPWPDPAPKVSGLGDEFYIDLYQEEAHAGLVEVWDGAGQGLGDIDNDGYPDPLGYAPISYGPNWFEIVVPLTLLGNDDGLLNYDVVVGDGTGLTDQAADYQAIQAGGYPAASVIPEPPSADLFGFGLALAGIAFMCRRVRAT